MKRTILCLIFFISIPMISPNESLAQWIQTSGPTGGFVNRLLFMPKSTGDTDLFAGTNAGVFRSTDYGMSWTLANNGITPDIYISGVYEPPPILALASIGDTL
ncbi:MAG TPA: hypothetical protein VKI62_00800, partial [Bacteroidota bacterium]|nr:hypothetical protein [Bacteroidota bacterium]